MLDTFLNALTTPSADITILHVVLTLVIAFILGGMVSLTYIFTFKKGVYSQSFVHTLIMLPAIISIIILLVGSNIARAFSLAGAFSIIRFRSAPGDPKDIAYVFFAMAAGLACGVGLYGYAIVFAVVLCGFMFLISKINYGHPKHGAKILKILIPEDMNYRGVFDEVFQKYTRSFQLEKVRTTDLGSLYELVYTVVMEDTTDEKEFMDELRCRNGNLAITLVFYPEKTER